MDCLGLNASGCNYFSCQEWKDQVHLPSKNVIGDSLYLILKLVSERLVDEVVGV